MNISHRFSVRTLGISFVFLACWNTSLNLSNFFNNNDIKSDEDEDEQDPYNFNTIEKQVSDDLEKDFEFFTQQDDDDSVAISISI